MLLQRALDPIDGAPSDGTFGQRLFVFTDDLDVTNRLYFDLLDAEGLSDAGNPVKPSLASLRVPREDVAAPDLERIPLEREPEFEIVDDLQGIHPCFEPAVLVPEQCRSPADDVEEGTGS